MVVDLGGRPVARAFEPSRLCLPLPAPRMLPLLRLLALVRPGPGGANIAPKAREAALVPEPYVHQDTNVRKSLEFSK